MKAHILDADALKAVSPIALAAFARTEGWKLAEPFGEHADIYIGPNLPEIIIPRTDRLADYAAAVSRLLVSFAEKTGHDELSMYRDLIGADCDVIRVRTFLNEDDGAIPIDAGVRVIQQAREMLLAAACATRSPQPTYRAGANKEATEYMQRVKLGQTEHGSFVVTLLAPVPPSLGPHQLALDTSWVDYEDEPLERQVTRRLMSSLEAARSAAESILSGAESAFENAVPNGVSANLCEALATLIEQSNDLEVSLTWARTRPTPEPLRRVTFSKNDAYLFKEAARTFRLREPKPNSLVYGTVFKLTREHDETEGVVTLKALIDERVQSVAARLDDYNYDLAVSAHREHQPIVLRGDLARNKQRWVLKDAEVIRFSSEMEEE